jgi:hypothetical protein
MTDANEPVRDAAWKHRELTYGTCAVCGEARDLRQTTDADGNPKVELYAPCGHTDEEQAAAASS